MPRVAYFPDSFHEVNGVAHTSRNFEEFARRHGLPFLCIRAGDREPELLQDGSVWTLELPRGIFSFALEKDLRLDPAFLRHIPQIENVLARFQPDLIHVTGPSDVGVVGAGLALALDLPLAASWHTNLHEYAARRSEWLLHLLPRWQAEAAGQKIEEMSFAMVTKFYASADVLFAPNQDLCALLARHAAKPCLLMPRGVDAELFHPQRRTRPEDERPRVLGFVGRLSVEKNVALLATVQEQLEKAGVGDFRFMIVGHGMEETWLRQRLPGAKFTGVLRGEALARAYANMDLFVFPSHTDTFGNVVLEALASGVPAIVTPDGGPKSIVRDGLTGRVVADGSFAAAIAELLSNPAKHNAMRQAARTHAETASWDAVFEGVYRGYEGVLPHGRRAASLCDQGAVSQVE
ncbi:MAG TPA: glycosyltransferase [Terracidiphilus sp.]|jgi:glycosyltransferase involved in cell wall biosynthesis